jgi:hypothetical protein
MEAAGICDPTCACMQAVILLVCVLLAADEQWRLCSALQCAQFGTASRDCLGEVCGLLLW